jgi:hypothetical protein
MPRKDVIGGGGIIWPGITLPRGHLPYSSLRGERAAPFDERHPCSFNGQPSISDNSCHLRCKGCSEFKEVFNPISDIGGNHMPLIRTTDGLEGITVIELTFQAAKTDVRLDGSCETAELDIDIPAMGRGFVGPPIRYGDRGICRHCA